jgi:hypothetical protein
VNVNQNEHKAKGKRKDMPPSPIEDNSDRAKGGKKSEHNDSSNLTSHILSR